MAKPNHSAKLAAIVERVLQIMLFLAVNRGPVPTVMLRRPCFHSNLENLSRH